MRGPVSIWRDLRQAFELVSDARARADFERASRLGTLWPGYEGYRAAAGEAFANPWIYRCVREISETMAGVPWYAADERGARLSPADERARLLARPSDATTLPAWTEMWSTYLLLRGEVIGHEIVSTDERLLAIDIIEPPRLHRDLRGGEPRYSYDTLDGRRVDIEPERLVRWALLDPINRQRGFAPAAVVVGTARLDALARQWTEGLVLNGARPGGTVSWDHDARPSATQQADLRDDIMGRVSGARARGLGSIIALPKGARFDETGLTPRDMDWSGLRNANAVEICAVFGMSPELIGARPAKYANWQQAREGLPPRHDRAAEPAPGRRDRPRGGALLERRDRAAGRFARAGAARRLLAAAGDRAQARGAGLSRERRERAAGARDAAAGGRRPRARAARDAGRRVLAGFASLRPSLGVLESAPFEAAARRGRGKAQGGLGGALDALFGEIATKAAETFQSQGARGAALKARQLLDDGLDAPWRSHELAAALKWAKPARGMLQELREEMDSDAGSGEAAAVIPVRLAVDPVTEELDRQIAAEVRLEIERQIADGRGTIVNHVLDRVSAVLSESQMAGIGVEAAARALRERGGLETYRAFRIARTEIHQGFNATTQTAAARMVPGALKVWSAQTGDGRTRKAHAAANGQKRQMNALFEVGGDRLRWPGDRSQGAGAKQIVNCRCVVGYRPAR